MKHSKDWKLRLPVLFFFVLLILSAGSCRRKVEVQAKPLPSGLPDILLVSIDTLRVDRLGCYGHTGALTPTIDRLVHEGIHFSNAWAPVPMTLPSHAALLSGRYPRELGLYDNAGGRLADSVPVLPDILRKQGYETAAFVSAYVLAAPFGLDRGFSSYIHVWDSSDLKRSLTIPEATADRTADRVVDWMGGRKNSPSPFFTFVHYYDPHMPYAPPADLKAVVEDPYDGEVANVDRSLGRILDHLPRPDQTMIILVSDHGEALGDHGEKTHGYFIYGDTMRVLMVMHLPSMEGLQAPIVTREPVSLVDVFPTILGVLGMEVPYTGPGLDLSEKDHPDRAVLLESMVPFLHHGFSPLRGLVKESWSYIRAPRPELYRLEEDPAQHTNLWSQENQEGRSLERALQSILASNPLLESGKGFMVREEDRRQVQSLGYLAGVSSPEGINDLSGMDLPDPKDGLVLLRTIEEITLLLSEERWREAEAVLNRARSSYPGDASLMRLSGDLYRRENRWIEAMTAYQAALKQSPDQIDLLLKIGQGLLHLKRYPEARSTLEAYLQKIPGDPPACYALGIIALEQGDPFAAVARFRQALDGGFDDPEVRWRLARALDASDQVEEAKEVLDLLVADMPDYFPAWYSLGELARARGDRDRALQAYRRSWELNRGFLPAGLALVDLLLEEPPWGDAGEILAAMKKLDPGNPELHLREAHYILLQGKLNQGCAILKALPDRLLESSSVQTRHYLLDTYCSAS
ncbi:MAG TPA: sulfatase-like hydrolase/transferase [Thermoanaerobaculia bacterium]|nr:sulfatase-like hydrolase/transferase [Thermoanaerobaculia bacterium]HUM30533.1 sulfatase-like hydrolase/transferase [Thermoanaerobaculia bacterium]HXK68725.1 sulfatase-like hydrolase/transferase [Thermoanaerobaculia bacterium]